MLPRYLSAIDVPFRIVEQDTYSVVKRVIAEGKTTCSLCSRLRRGVLYRVAGELGATKIALGHHRDDILETLFLNLFYGGKLKTMPPKLVSDDGRNIVIRPLAYCKEKDLAEYAEIENFPIIPCNLCGSQKNMQRQARRKCCNNGIKNFPADCRLCLPHCKISSLPIWPIRGFTISRGSRRETNLFRMGIGLSTPRRSSPGWKKC